MHKDLEGVARDYHAALAGLHGFAALFFLRRLLRHPERRLVGWTAFHLIGAGVSILASHIHARDAR